jgi:hypothetical protein
MLLLLKPGCAGPAAGRGRSTAGDKRPNGAELCFRFKPIAAQTFSDIIPARAIHDHICVVIAALACVVITVPVSRLCALTIGARLPERSSWRTRDRYRFLRHRAKYGERVVYARRRSGDDEAEPAHGHLGDVRGVFAQPRSRVKTETNIPNGVACPSRCGHYCFERSEASRAISCGARWRAVITLTATAFPLASGGSSLCQALSREETSSMTVRRTPPGRGIPGGA